MGTDNEILERQGIRKERGRRRTAHLSSDRPCLGRRPASEGHSSLGEAGLRTRTSQRPAGHADGSGGMVMRATPQMLAEAYGMGDIKIGQMTGQYPNASALPRCTMGVGCNQYGICYA